MELRWVLLNKMVRVLLVLVVMLGWVGGLLLIVQARAVAVVVNGVFLDHQRREQYVLWLAILAIAFLFRGLLMWSSETISSRMVGQVKTGLRQQLVSHLLALGPTYVQKERSGELANSLLEGVEKLDPYITRYIPQMAISTVVPITILIVVFAQDWISGLILLVTAPLIPLFMILIGKGAQKLNERQWQTLSLLSAHFLDILQGLQTLKIFGRSKAQTSVMSRISEEYRDRTMSVLRVAFMSALVLELLTTLGTAMVAVEIGLRLVAGDMSFVAGFFVLLLTPEFYSPIRQLGVQFHAGLEGKVAARRLKEILATPMPVPSMDGVQRAETEKFAPLRDGTPTFLTHSHPCITLSEVNFQYPEASITAVRNVSFTTVPCERVALIGDTGAGKSTLLRLIMGFLEPSQGQIMMDGVDLSQVPLAEWRRQLAYVPQKPHLFYGSVLDNLRMANPLCDDAQVVIAAKRAGADEFIRKLPRGYETHLGENGARLSGGEAQRIALARAFLRDSPILLLDEPTAHLDAESEWAISQAVDELLKTKTAIIVAHRLSTILRADQILVMQHGEIVERGTHAELDRDGSVFQKFLMAYRGEEGWTES